MVERPRDAAAKTWRKIARRPMQAILALLVIAGGTTTALIAANADSGIYTGCGYGYSGYGYDANSGFGYNQNFAFGYGDCPGGGGGGPGGATTTTTTTTTPTTTTTTPTTTTTTTTTSSQNPCINYTGIQEYICLMYEDLLGHLPDAQGLAFWTAQFGSGPSPSSAKLTAPSGGGKVALGIASSAEHDTDLVTSWYQRFLHRAPEPGGLSTWVGQLGSGVTDEHVIAMILGSYEFFVTDSGGNPSTFITALYLDLLGRAPDSGGLAGFEAAMAKGATPAQVAYSIATSPEYETDLVTSYYGSAAAIDSPNQNFLSRAPDPGGLSFWVSQLASGATDEAVIAGIMASNEYYTLSQTTG